MCGPLAPLVMALPGMATGVLNYLGKKTDADLEKYKAGVGADAAVNVEAIRGHVELSKLDYEQRKADREHWTTRWMAPSAFGLCLLYAGSIIFDSMTFFGHVVGSWGIVDLPGKWTDVVQNILLAGCGISGAGILGGIAKRIFTK